jgi:CRISPR-associated protein Csx10
MLHQFAGVKDKDESLHLEAAYSSYEYLSGWNAAWGLMKDVELITKKGGCICSVQLNQIFGLRD